MMEMSLYRKYQPTIFKEIVGQSLIKKILLNSISQKRVSHAYIFSGPHGIGKTSISRIFSKAINCLNYENDCCNTCINCVTINKSEASDIIELDAASNNGVNDIREMINNINYLPHLFKWKIYIIDEVHMLSSSAWNALLKTIENPPKHVIFIFATTEVNKIPLTIISRCQKFDFSKISTLEIITLLDKIAKNENFKISNDAIQLLSQISNGSLRDAISMIDQVTNFAGISEITSNDVEILFGLTSINMKIKIIDNIIKKNFSELISIFNDLEIRGANFLNLTKEMIELFIDKIIYIKTDSCRYLKKLSEININNFEIDTSILYSMIDIFQDGFNDIKNNFDERFFFEIIIWKSIKLFDSSNEKNLNFYSKNFNSNLNQEISKLEEDINLIENKIDHNKFEINEEEIILKKVISNIDDNPNKSILLENVLNVKKIEDQEKNDIFYKMTPVEFTKNENKKEELNIIENINQENKAKAIFFKIAYNNKSNIKIDLNNIFKEINNSIQVSPMKGFISNASKILLASNNGIVFLFEDNLSADNLNEVSTSRNFLLYIKKEFKKIYYVIGVSNINAKIYGNEYKKNLSKKIFYEDCDLSSLEAIILKKKSTKNIALDIFKEELLGE